MMFSRLAVLNAFFNYVIFGKFIFKDWIVTLNR